MDDLVGLLSGWGGPAPLFGTPPLGNPIIYIIFENIWKIYRFYCSFLMCKGMQGLCWVVVFGCQRKRDSSCFAAPASGVT